ncbi:hypothetical protein WS70_28410 [Burkholderia mayonis]|uniref:Uncharacterized protein n=1 Tax=Burkholderia mayonis TaxID=1385591 RepID=A0A1B4FPH9_9BURK|nr:hypothetical protein WS70_28410 [Burkholderia mayonis]KVE34705.1 hypothetical protein WS69_16155 [Burkholderia sp. BDU5]KVE45653.1 hypothetical protein WS70_04255 [Burkholderia mayonis]
MRRSSQQPRPARRSEEPPSARYRCAARLGIAPGTASAVAAHERARGLDMTWPKSVHLHVS